jgi:hypothetical protein
MKITVTRAEGPTRLLTGPVVCQTWEEADREIRKIAETAPEKGYDKTDVVVEFEDGAAAGIRYDVKRDTVANTKGEFLAEFGFFAGVRRPPAMTEESYQSFLAYDWVAKGIAKSKALHKKILAT